MLPPIKKPTSRASAFRVKVWGWMGHFRSQTAIFINLLQLIDRLDKFDRYRVLGFT